MASIDIQVNQLVSILFVVDVFDSRSVVFDSEQQLDFSPLDHCGFFGTFLS